MRLRQEKGRGEERVLERHVLVGAGVKKLLSSSLLENYRSRDEREESEKPRLLQKEGANKNFCEKNRGGWIQNNNRLQDLGHLVKIAL